MAVANFLWSAVVVVAFVANRLVASSDSVLAAWTPERLQQEVDAAIGNGSCFLQIPGGQYRFNQTSFRIHNATSLAIVPDSQVELWFSGNAGVNFSHCTEVTFGHDAAEVVIDYDPPPPSRPTFRERAGITLHMVNCTRIKTERVTIRAAPFMAVTAFNGGGDHIFRRLRFEPSPGRDIVGTRDALHFSDLRVGPTVVDSEIGFTGDDFFNVHTTMALVLECSEREYLLVNPRVTPGAPRDTVYGTFSVLRYVRPGDVVSFYSWPATDMILRRVGPPAEVRSLIEETDPRVLAEAAKLPPHMAHPPNMSWIDATNQTVNFSADEVWRVQFNSSIPPGIGQCALVAVDTISSRGAKLINNTFTHSGCNIGRFKSSDGFIIGNTFRHAKIPNLEITALPQWFEGPAEIQSIEIRDNTIMGEGDDPIHCGPLCERPGCLVPPACAACPNCEMDTPWAQTVLLKNNTIRNSLKLGIVDEIL